ncbi:hypothetical protein [Arundinibacter roseus]|uniref:hypothetical protein n=1 Tax=Arundinibacter roseus TaxID=2070510 RepID=UPI00140479E2|nr:hypothetical protein [Arundinibacter roseus]
MRNISEKLRAKLRLIMQRAWGLFHRGVVSFSMSLRLSWGIQKGKVNESTLLSKLRKRG